MTRYVLASALLLSACGGSVAAEAPATVVEDTGTKPETTPEPIPEWSETASCAAITASCSGAEPTVVNGHAEGLDGLDGARVEFAVRYILEEGMGTAVPRGVALGRTHVAGGTFSTCVCVPQNAGMYPDVAAVIYRPGSSGVTSADVARATFSARYATGTAEDLAYALGAVPSAAMKESALAAMVDRAQTITLELKAEGRVYGGLIADERPIAAQVTAAVLISGKAELVWLMPGRAWKSERLAFFVDKNADGKCDGSDVGGFAPFASSIALGEKLLTGAELTPVCDALAINAPRE